MERPDTKRKLIDISEPTIEALSFQAKAEGVSLKKYIERLLDKAAERSRSSIPDSVTDPRIRGLLGIIRYDNQR